MMATLASALFAAAWKGSLLAAFALAVHRIARNRVPARWTCALLLVAIVRLLLPAAPSAPFSVFNLVPSTTAVTAAPMVIVASGATLPQPPIRVPLRTELPRPVTPMWQTALLLIWAAGAAFFLARAAVRAIRFHRQLSDSRDVDLSPLIDECRSLLQVRRRVRVALTDAVATPSLHGWLRPTLLLPYGFIQSFSRAQVRYVLLHELAHLRRSDVLIHWLATAAQALHWFNPLVHLAAARLAEECELASDAMALDALRDDERPAYGGTVVDVVDRMRKFGPVPALVGMTATPQQLKRRIVMIARFRQSSRFSILFAALVLTVGMVTLTDASAGEVRVMKHHILDDLSPAAKATMEKLDQRITTSLTSASAEDVARTVFGATGVNVTFPDGVLSDEARNTRFTLTATDVPAHMVLMETLSSVGLGLKFTDNGAEVIEAKDKLMIPAHGEGERVIVMRHHGDAGKHELPVPSEPVTLEPGPAGHRRVEVKATAEEKDGVTTKKLTVDMNDGKPAGTLEIQVQK